MPSSSPQPAFRDEEEKPAQSLSRSALKHFRKLVVGVVGTTVCLIGIAMIVLPGPAFVVIPAGLGILAIEFAWARRLLEELKKRGKNVLGRE